MRVFGVGCIFFGYADDDFDMATFDLVQFKTDVVSALEGLENVSNVETENADGRNIGFRSFEDDENGDLVIIPCGFGVSFDLFMPRRIQAQYGAELSVENFHIDLLYGYDRPVMYCSYEVDEGESANQQHAVMVVRKFLEQKLDGSIFCKSIAPSPFHAEFVIRVEEGASVTINDISESKSGIKSLEIVVSPALASMQQAIDLLNPTLSRFYYLSTLRSKLIHDRSGILRGISELLEKDVESWWARMKSHFSMRRSIDQLHRNIVEEKVDRIECQNYLVESSGYDEIGAGTPLSKYFDEYREMSSERAWSDFVDVARFFEDRRHKVFGNLSVLIAGLVGGLIGAMIGGAATLYAASLSGDAPVTRVEQQVSPANLPLPSARHETGAGGGGKAVETNSVD